ncbi:MAG TPA: lasso peptide biosynthesis B2 protein [Arenicellales bacterium]|nr:lasso peptide biosynthesis B2 protein [Arenicellales bacterium]
MKLNHLPRFFQLPNSDRAALLKAAPILLGTVAGLHLLGLKRTLWLLDRIPLSRRPSDGATGLVAREHRAVERVSRATGLGTCLSRSLALYPWLRRQGIDAQLRIGVHKDGHGLTAHAWLESGGEAIGGQASGQYQPFSPIRVGRPG